MIIEWISKEEAGVRLGVPGRPLSSRRVLELAKEGKLQSQLVRDVESGQMTTQIHAGSVERFRDERSLQNRLIISDENADAQAREVRAPRAPQPSQALALLREVCEGLRAAPSARLWLTLNEAADYSGLPAAVLLNFITLKKIQVLNVGRRRGGQWRIRRAELDRFEG
jgi:Helix-turn-helix domain